MKKFYLITNKNNNKGYFEYDYSFIKENNLNVLKSFFKEEKALEYAKDNNIKIVSSYEEMIEEPKEKEVVVYISGSSDGKRYSYAVVMKNDNVMKYHVGTNNNKDFMEIKSGGGKITAAAYAITKAIEMGAKSVEIVTDFDALIHLGTGFWKPNSAKPWALKWAKFVFNHRNKIQIKFRKAQYTSNKLKYAYQKACGALAAAE